jgi:hypothetical protein
MMRLLKHYLYAAAITCAVVSWQITNHLHLAYDRAEILLNDLNLPVSPRYVDMEITPELAKFQRPDFEPLRWYLTPERTFVTCITRNTADNLCHYPTRYAFRYIDDLRAMALFFLMAALLLTFFTRKR